MSAFMGTNIMFWNCQGIGSKRKELQLYLKENNFDIVALNEIFFTKRLISKFKVIPFYWDQRWSCLPRKTWPSY